jgi:carbon starvation protein CstA
MIKKIVAFSLLVAVSLAPTISLAAISAATQVSATVKMADTAQVIRLASNDITQIQGAERKVAAKVSASDDSSADLSKIPPQAWLVLAALFCFVMRSSRRTV